MHAKTVFINLINKNFGDYHDLYVRSDTLLFSHVFENFRNISIKVYELDPAHFLSAPGLAWQAYLKRAEVKLELLMVEKGIRGGICHSMHRHAKANNKSVKDYNKDEEESFLEYLDAKKLYGWAMPEPLPVDDFDWIKDLSRIDEDFIKNYDTDSNKGYMLEEDVEHPKHLQFLYLGNISHSDLPFLPEKLKINKIKKLICDLSGKENYVCHIKLLQQALNHGLILKKVQRVIQFNQEAWLKPYIDMNTELRKQPKKDFKKDFYKLMNNAVFGKTMENVRKHRDIKLVTIDKRRNQLVSEPNYHTIKWFSEKRLAIKMKKTKVKMNKPI